MRVFEPRRIRLQSRILLYFVPVLVGAVALVVFTIDYRKSNVLLDMSRDRGLAIAHSLEAASSSQLLSYNYVSLQQLAEGAAKEEGLGYVIILDKEGAVAGYSGRPEWQGRTLDDRTNTAATASRKTLVQKVQTPLLGHRPGLDISVPVFVEGSPVKWGTVRVGLSMDSIYNELYRTRMAILALGIVVLLIAFFVARELSRRITGPLGRLMEATNELARGNFDFRAAITTGDEIEYLSDRFDEMAHELRQKQFEVQSKNRELAALNTCLEDKVKERTRALTEAEEKYRILVEFSPDPICIFQGHRLVFFNKALCRTFGYGEKELSAPEFDVSSLISPECREEFLAQMDHRNDDGGDGEHRNELIGIHRDGSRVFLDFRSTWINYSGEPALEAILVDVTTQKELQDKMVSYERLSALGEMASGVAHDFNNILGAILARAQFLQQKTEDDEVLRGLRVIERAASDGGATVMRIQDFSRVRTDRDFDHIDVNIMLEEVVELTRNTWEDEARRQAKRITLVQRYCDGGYVEGSAHELREVFTNLMINAVDAIESEGTITLETRDEGGNLVILVADDGAGMSEETQRRLFDPFFSTKGVKGTGLGMSIVYGIITRHGGDITFESEEGKGTTFTVVLPRSEDGAAEPPVLNPVEPGSLIGAGKVLVVDDEPDIRELVRDILTDAGYDVQVAGGGAEAIDLARAFPFDLVLTDLGMPDVGGWEVAEECRRLQPEIRLMLFTGWGASLDPEEVAARGIDRTMAKPFKMHELLRLVGEIMRSAPLKRSA